MIGLLSALSGLALFAVVVSWRRRRGAAEMGPSRPESAPVLPDQDLLPESGKDQGDNGLAAFYSYQMAVAKINRH